MNTAQKIAAIETSDYSLAWDTCHKIYLLGDSQRVTSAEGIGYDIFPASEIREIILNSCGLVFVSNWGLDTGDWEHPWAIEQCTEDIYEAAEAGRNLADTLVTLTDAASVAGQIPLPRDYFNGGIVVASTWLIDDKDRDPAATVLTLEATAPFYRVHEITWRSGEWKRLDFEDFPNIVPAVEHYRQNGGDY